MSDEGRGPNPLLALLWGALFASGNKGSRDHSQEGLGYLTLILLVIAAIPFVPLMILAGGLVGISYNLGVHPVFLALSACMWMYWMLVLAGLIYRYLPIVVSSSLTAIYLAAAYIIAALLLLRDWLNYTDDAAEILKGNIAHVDWVLAAVIVIPLLVGCYFIGRYIARWIKASRKQSLRLKLILLAASVVLAVIDVSPLIAARATAPAPEPLTQIGSPGAVVATRDVPYVATRVIRSDGPRHYEGTFKAGQHLCVTVVFVGEGGHLEFGMPDGYVASAENDPGAFLPDTSPGKCGSVAMFACKETLWVRGEQKSVWESCRRQDSHGRVGWLVW